MGNNAAKIIGALLLLTWLALGAAGFQHYPGSKLVYCAFSVVFLCLIVSGFYRQECYGYMFFALFIWLGFWLKFTVHLVWNTPYIEPTGGFSPSPGNMDAVLWVAIAAASGAILARFLPFPLSSGDKEIFVSSCPVPTWYHGFASRIWMGMLFVVILLPLINVSFGVSQTGLVPKVCLPWPLSGIVPWILSTGLGLGVITILSWDVASGKSPIRGFYATIAECLFSSVSLLSRGIFLWHALPAVAVSLWRGREFLVKVSKLKLYVTVVIGITAFLFSFILVNALRHKYFAGGTGGGIASEFRLEASIFSSRVIAIGVDRWIGVDGVMAVHSCGRKGWQLLYDALLEKRSLNKMGLYQSICDYSYSGVDVQKYNFGSVPGVVAFFYYSGFLPAVFVGLFIVALLLRYSEEALRRYTANLFVCSFFGVTYASILAQFAMAPRQLIWQSLLMAGALFLIWLLQRNPGVRIRGIAKTKNLA